MASDEATAPPSSCLPQYLGSPAFDNAFSIVQARVRKEFRDFNRDILNALADKCADWAVAPTSPFTHTLRLRDASEGPAGGFVARFVGPAAWEAGQCPYEGGIFELEITVGPDYPLEPPSVRFVTPIYHPNIDCNTGAINLDVIIHPHWTPALGLRTIVLSVQALLAAPTPSDECWAHNEVMLEMTRLFRSDRKRWDTIAREWARRHADVRLWPPAVNQRAFLLLMLQQRISQAYALGGALVDIWVDRVMPLALADEIAAGNYHRELLPAAEAELFRQACAEMVPARQQQVEARQQLRGTPVHSRC